MRIIGRADCGSDTVAGTGMSDITDAERYQALLKHLAVKRYSPDSFTCWLELPEICFRDSSQSPQDIVDRLVMLYRRQLADRRA